MPVIPDVPEIQNSLLALSLVEVSQAIPDDRCIIVCEPIRQTQRSESGEHFFQDLSPLALHQSLGAPLTIPRLLDRISAEMHGAGHSHVSPKTDQRHVMAAKVLGMATALGGSKLALIETVNHIISAISPARVSQWAVLIGPGTGPEHYRFGDFIYGNVELEKLQYRSEKAGSDFARRYGESLQSRRSILREGRELKIIDVKAIQADAVPDPSSRNFMYRIYDCYYGDVASVERQVFMMDLDRQQAIFGAARRQSFAVRAEGYAVHTLRMACEWFSERLSPRHVPQPHRLVRTPRGERLPVGAERNTKHVVGSGGKPQSWDSLRL